MKLKTVYNDQTVRLAVNESVHRWSLWIRSAANLIPVTTDNKFLIMHEFKGVWVWGFPGGMIEPGETPMQAAKRECEEELGIKVKKTKKICVVTTLFPETSVHFFMGYGLTKTESKGWEKIGAVKKVSLKQLYQLALDGKISDPRAVVAVLKLFKKFGKKS